MWFATKAEALAHVRETAEGILDGGVDPHRGANDIWHSALDGLDLRPLRPLIDAGDALDYLEPSDPRRIQLEAEVVAVVKELLQDQAFWSQVT